MSPFLQLLARLLDKEQLQRVEDLGLQRALDRMADLLYCPKCGGPALEDADHCTQCPKCAPGAPKCCTVAFLHLPIVPAAKQGMLSDQCTHHPAHAGVHATSRRWVKGLAESRSRTEHERRLSLASRCFFVFCSLCNEPWHPGTQCMSPETQLELLRQRMAGNKNGAEEFRRKVCGPLIWISRWKKPLRRAHLSDAFVQHIQMRDLERANACFATSFSKSGMIQTLLLWNLLPQEQEVMSLASIRATAKQCPSCGMATEKSEGCNKMVCGACDTCWCWR